MDVRLTILDAPVTWEARAELRALCEAALWRFQHRIRYVETRLRDVNGHRGGVDKVCGLRVVTRSGACVHVADCGRSFEEALDRATTSAIARLLREKNNAAPRRLHDLERDDEAA